MILIAVHESQYRSIKIKTVSMKLILVLLTLSSPASVADIQGRWMVRMVDFDAVRMLNTHKTDSYESFVALGRMLEETVFDFKVDGATLTGTVTIGGKGAEISDGKIDGSGIAFAVNHNLGGQEIKAIYRGRVALNEIRFTREVQGEIGQEFTAKREFQRHNDIPLRRVPIPKLE
jgi:hypothetical protein